MIKSDKLPDTLSELLTVAITDGEKLDHGTYEPCSLYWHSGTDTFDPSKLCRVCLAGAVLVGSLGYSDPSRAFFMDEAGPRTACKLAVINEMRDGRFISAYRMLTNVEVEDLPDVLKPRACNRPDVECSSFFNWKEFQANLNSLKKAVVWLQKHNL